MKKIFPDSDQHRQNILLLSLICLLTYVLALRNGFIVDDFLFLSGEYDRVFRSLPDYFSISRSQHYQPLYYLVNQGLFHLLGASPEGYRLINVSLLVLACVSLYHLLSVLTGRRQMALLASTLFAVHPLTANSVNQITHNVILICLIGVLNSLSAYLKYFDSRRNVHLAISLVLFAIALLTVEAAALTLIYLAAILILFRKERLLPSLTKLWPFLLIFAAYLVPWSLVALKNLFAAKIAEHAGISWLAYVSSYGELLFWYLQNLISPTSVVLSSNILVPGASLWALFAVAVLAGVILLWKLCAKSDVNRLALIWVGAGFIYVMPALLTHPYMGMVLSPHWLLIPSIGFYMLAANTLLRTQEEERTFSWRPIFAGGLVLYFATFTLGYQLSMRSQISFCSFWAKTCPQHSIALFCLGNELNKKGEPEKAIAVYKRLLDIDKHRSGLILANLANLYFEAGDLDSAQAMAHRALESNEPGTYASRAHNTLGIVHAGRGQNDMAKEQFLQAYSIDPLNTLVIYNLCDTYILEGETQKALDFLESVPRQDLPRIDQHLILARLAGLYFQQNKVPKGLDIIDQIIKEDASFDSFVRIAGTLDSLGFDNLSRLMMEAALKTYPEKAPQSR